MSDEKLSDRKGSGSGADTEAQHTRTSSAAVPSSRFASIFGGQGVSIGPRIVPLKRDANDPTTATGDGAEVDSDLAGADNFESSSISDDSGSAILQKQLEAEAGEAIQYRTCSWQKTAFLLFSEYICLAIMSFPWSYSLLGLVPGLILTVVIAAIVLYTSLILWEFCLRHPEVRDVCDVGQALFWNKRWAWWATAVMFILNNTFIQALHVLIGAEYHNTMTEGKYVGGCRTVEFAVVITVICWAASLPRTFSMLSLLGCGSAIFTFISVLLATIFAGVEDHPAGYTPEMGEPKVTAGTPSTTTFVIGMSAFLNISYTFIGQITLPSFIAEMRDPRDFPKSLWACTIAEIITFSIVGAVIYAFTGDQYMTAPAFGSLQNPFKEISFSFMVPTLIFLGCLYASVTSRFVFFRLFHNTRHMNNHTVVGWASWAGILLVTWIMAFIISQVIPFFSSRKLNSVTSYPSLAR
jgi:hypothetical protein